MYKLAHFLFGWDYIVWTESYSKGIARVQVSPDGSIWYWQYRISSEFNEITYPSQVKWLTCEPEKYFK